MCVRVCVCVSKKHVHGQLRCANSDPCPAARAPLAVAHLFRRPATEEGFVLGLCLPSPEKVGVGLSYLLLPVPRMCY